MASSPGLQAQEGHQSIGQWLEAQSNALRDGSATPDQMLFVGHLRRIMGRPISKTRSEIDVLLESCQTLGKDLHPEIRTALFEPEGLGRQPEPSYDLWPRRPLNELEHLRSEGPVQFLLKVCRPSWASEEESRKRNNGIACRFDKAFKQKFEGNAVDQFVRDLEVYRLLYNKSRYYGRIIAIIQSSGTGKSRLMRELANTIPSVTVTFRSPRYYKDISEGWPPPDQSVQDFLLKRRPNVRAEMVAGAFLGAMFKFLIAKCNDGPLDSNALGQRWVTSFMIEDASDPKASTRHRSFDEIKGLAEELLDTYAGTLGYNGEDYDQNALATWYGQVYETLCYGEVKALASILQAAQHNFIVIGFDECHFLNSHEGLKSDPTGMTIRAFRRVIGAADGYRTGAFHVWYTFIDADASSYDLVPHRRGFYSSHRGGELDLLMPYPFTGFDQLAPSDASNTPQDGLDIDRVRKYGRPLWSADTVEPVEQLASNKLFGGKSFSPHSPDPDDVLAAFSQRVGLTLAHSPESNCMAVKAVHSHMRMLYAATNDTCIETRVPSEPILALAAALTLRPSTHSIRNAIIMLADKLAGHVVDHGVQGQLCARLLLTLARDAATYCAHTTGPDRDYFINLEGTRRFIATVTLEDLLKKLHGSHEDAAYLSLLYAARRKHVNFTHFIHLDKEVGNISASFLHYLWDRQCAIQCTHSQPVVNIIIPTYTGSLDAKWDDDNTGTFSIQVKTKGRVVNASAVDALVGPRINGRRPQDDVVMLMEFGAQENFETTGTIAHYSRQLASVPLTSSWNGYERPETVRRWCIHISGYSGDAYPVIRPHWAPFKQIFERLCPWPKEFSSRGDAFEALLSGSVSSDGNPIVVDLDETTQ